MSVRAYWGGWVKRWPRLKSKGEFKIDLNSKFEAISDFGKTLEICTRKFRRNLNMRIFFLNSSRLLKDF
jgi:hypothetical protein